MMKQVRDAVLHAQPLHPQRHHLGLHLRAATAWPASALVGLIIAHVYFAIRPEKFWITKSMMFGWITRRQYLEHHEPARWRVPGSDPVGGRPLE